MIGNKFNANIAIHKSVNTDFWWWKKYMPWVRFNILNSSWAHIFWYSWMPLPIDRPINISEFEYFNYVVLLNSIWMARNLNVFWIKTIHIANRKHCFCLYFRSFTSEFLNFCISYILGKYTVCNGTKCNCKRNKQNTFSYWFS